MGRPVYSRSDCIICGRSISNAGAAYVNHMRTHVREGKVVEVLDPLLDRYVFHRVREKLKKHHAATFNGGE